MKPTISIARRAYFSVGRRLTNPAWDEAANRDAFGMDAQPHGHDYTVTVYYTGEPSDVDGMIVNITEIKPLLAKLLGQLDGRFLDEEVDAFRASRPTVENIVDFLWRQMPRRIATATLSRLCVQQSENLWALRSDDGMKLTKKYEFAAAHRLHAPTLPEAENQARYGKCNNPRGHGHNYNLEVTVAGEPDPATGYIMPPSELDSIVEEEVFERFDHKHLNEDCPEFENLIPTSENLAAVIFQRLRGRLDRDGRRLVKIGLHETQKNYFEVEA